MNKLEELQQISEDLLADCQRRGFDIPEILATLVFTWGMAQKGKSPERRAADAGLFLSQALRAEEELHEENGNSDALWLATAIQKSFKDLDRPTRLTVLTTLFAQIVLETEEKDREELIEAMSKSVRIALALTEMANAPKH